jgi:heparosan-N-sulfate-glucuronate 5-epimerase
MLAPRVLRSTVDKIKRTLHQDDFWHGETRTSEHFRPGELAGYPDDLRPKTQPFSGPTNELGVPLADYGPKIGTRLHPVTVCQVALGWHERWLHDKDRAHLDRFLALADWLIDNQKPWASGGAWPVDVTLRSYGRIDAPWVSSLVQGQALSVLARAAQLSRARTTRARAAMEAAFVLFERDVARGGVRCEDDSGVGYEEYASARPSIVLNGLIRSLFGVYDFALVQGDGPARRVFDGAVAALLRRLPRYDLGFWSRYCLYPYPVPEIASPYYHRAHVALLDSMNRLIPDERWVKMRARFIGYQQRTVSVGMALALKSVSRLQRIREYELPTSTGRVA